jgi:hypothetical protein
MTYRHCAYNLSTGEILNAPSGNVLKRAVSLTNRIDRKFYGHSGNQWRFSHDFGKSWIKNGFPTR